VKAKSECVAPDDAALGGVVEIMRMFQAACAASHRPAARPTRGSGLGAVIETIGVTGGGITAGGGGGGVGRAPPRAPPNSAGAPAGGVCVGVCCGACAKDDAISMAATREPEMSVAVFFIRKAPSKLLYRCEHLAHDLDLDRLVGKDVRSELVNHIVLRGAKSFEEVVHHIDRTLVMFDHP
jgi:hypothetical protein